MQKGRILKYTALCAVFTLLWMTEGTPVPAAAAPGAKKSAAASKGAPSDADLKIPDPVNAPEARKRHTAATPPKDAPPCANTIAVVKSRYDDVELVLDTYRIPYDTIQYRDLDTAAVYGRYRAIFFPCGIVPPMNERIRVVNRGPRIQSVSLRDDFREIDMEKAAQCIRDFVEGGGSAYFSGYSYEFLQRAYRPFLFFDNFPHMGMPGRIESRLRYDIARFCVKTKMALYMEHTGWIALRAALGEVIVDGRYATARGRRSGPISVLLRRGAGEVLYTSYHSTVFSDFRRFNIYRVAGTEVLRRACAMAERWDQVVTGRIVDAVHAGENHRMYYLPLRSGSNSICYLFPKAPHQIDILNKDMSLIRSRDSFETSGCFDIISDEDTYCLVRVYPSTRRRYGVFAMVSAHGVKSIPHPGLVMKIGLGVFGLLILVVIKRLFFGRRYSGRFEL
ncbi:MAG: hypothetical protein JXA20_11555 [Spirochaetes bacterium]|nr:hypothetical protein [Spirochaetota bacterium]